MDIAAYCRINEQAQWDLLWSKGQYLKKVKFQNTTFELYCLFNFFVEVTVRNNLEIPSDLVPFEKGQQLEKYIKEVDLAKANLL
ncbi:MAG: hypothetical protein AAGF96_18750 [Bacteroidota bacterium]